MDESQAPGLWLWPNKLLYSNFFFIYIAPWIKEDADQSPLPIRGLIKWCIEKRGRTCLQCLEDRDQDDIEQGFVSIRVKTKLTARPYSFLMFIDEETGGPQQGIVSPKWCPLISQKATLVFSLWRVEFNLKGLMVHLTSPKHCAFCVLPASLAWRCLPSSLPASYMMLKQC